MASESIPSTSVEVPAFGSERETIVAFSAKARRWIVVVALTLGFLLPGVALHFDARGYSISCTQQTRKCVITEHRAFQDIATTIGFNDIRNIMTHAEWTGDSDDREQTGRLSMSFVMHDGRRITASLPVDPDLYRRKDLNAHLFDGRFPTYSFTAVRPWSDSWTMLLFFFAGLLLVVSAWWRKIVTYDDASGFLTVQSRQWPLMKRTTLHARADTIKNIWNKSGDSFQTVEVEVQGKDTHVVVGRYIFGGRAEMLGDALRGYWREARQKKNSG